MKKFLSYLIASLPLFTTLEAHAYPLDSFDETNIKRLEGYYYSLPTPSGRQMMPAGACLSVSEIFVGPRGVSTFPPQRDAYLQSGLNQIAQQYKGGVSLALLDISNERNPAYAGVNDSQSFMPGSVGKLMVAVSLFDALARNFPSTQMREKVLREHMVTADELIEGDTHVVPYWDEPTRTVNYRPLQIGDTENLWSFIDFMLSPSSNAAASMVMREVLLMNYLGERYATTPSDTKILEALSPAERSSLMKRSFLDPLYRLPIPAGKLAQGSFFTKFGKSLMPSLGSTATVKDLVHLLLLIEQGQLIDTFSSLEIKRLLYLTQKRERYVGTPALKDSAVYFKAGSFSRCRSSCEKYEGDVLNLLNGVAIIESPVAAPRLRYIVALSTNVLRRNAEEVHQDIAEQVHRLIAMRAGQAQ